MDLGDLYFTVNAETGEITALRRELGNTETASNKLTARLTKVSSTIKSVTANAASLTAKTAALVGSLGLIAQQAASAGRELQTMAQISNTSVERFQELAYGAASVGVQTDKLGDIFKDTQDKVGDFLATGGGELADYFEKIAPLAGQTAEQFKNLSGPDALMLFQKGLDSANLSASEQIFYLESLASDAALLRPLLQDNAKGFEENARKAREMNLVLSEAEVKSLAEVSVEFNKLLATIAKVTQKIVAENAPEIKMAIQSMVDIINTAAPAISGFFKRISGDNSVGASELNAQISGLQRKILELSRLSDTDFAKNAGYDEFGKKIAQTQRKIEKFSEEYERLENDTLMNPVVRVERMEIIAEKLGLMSGELIILREQLSKAKEGYVSVETTNAQNQITELIEKLRSLNGGISPNKIEITSGSVDHTPVYENNDQAIMGPEIDRAALNVQMREMLGVTQEMANQIETIDQKFQNLGATITDSLVQSAYDFSDAIGQAMAQGIADGDNLQDVFKNVAGAIGTQLLGSLISLGVQYGINALLKSAADAKMAASSAAAMTATTAAGVTQAGILSAAYAPAAAGASIASFGGAAVSGGTALTSTYALAKGLSVTGGRLYGGSVSAGSAYQVTEDGRPEMLTVGSKNILLMGSQSGKITSNKDFGGSQSASSAPTINIYQAPEGTTASANNQDGQWVIDVFVGDMNARGKAFKAVTSTTTANPRI